MLKQIGTATRKELELATDQKVFLKMEVAVDPKWPERFV
jgi:GTPase Era involved in 16S rRNA processing